MLEALAPQLLDDRLGGFTLSRQWTNEFMKVYMNWTIRKGTTAASKLPLDWMKQGLNMNFTLLKFMASHHLLWSIQIK
jgi:hypothetical protein